MPPLWLPFLFPYQSSEPLWWPLTFPRMSWAGEKDVGGLVSLLVGGWCGQSSAPEGLALPTAMWSLVWHKASRMFSIFWAAKHAGCLRLLGLLVTHLEAGEQHHAREEPQELKRG